MIFVLLLSCADTVFAVHSEYCQDWDPDSEPELRISTTELGFEVSRVGVERACESIFVGDVVLDGRDILIYEIWEDGPESECTICYAPTIAVQDPPGGTLTVKWYNDSGQASAVHTAEVDG